MTTSTTPACRRDPDAWFPEGREGKVRQANKARALCAQCHNRAACAKAALDLEATHGIWGGIWLDRAGMSNNKKNAMLAKVAGINPPPPREYLTETPSHCVNPDCAAPIVAQSVKPIPDGARRHGAGGLCNSCYMRERRNRGREVSPQAS